MQIFTLLRGAGQKQPLEVFCKKKLFLKILQYSQENTYVKNNFKTTEKTT